MKRTLPALLLPQTPLVYVIAHVGISPIVHIGKYLPELQEQIRLNGFPRFKRGFVHEVLLDAQGPKVLSSDRFEFLNRDETLSIVVSANFVAVQTSRYHSFEKFEESIRFALTTVLNVVKTIGLAERIGVRYIDWLRNDVADEGVLKFLRPNLHCLDTKAIGVKNVLRRSEVSGETECGKFVAKFYQQVGQLLPPEIGQTNLAEPAVSVNGVVSLLDFDHYSEIAVDFDPDAILGIMESLHDKVDLAFRNSVTQEAIDMWSKPNGK